MRPNVTQQEELEDQDSPCIRVTNQGFIGINVGNKLIVRTAQEWYAVAEENTRLREALEPFAEEWERMQRNRAEVLGVPKYPSCCKQAWEALNPPETKTVVNCIASTPAEQK